MAGRYVWLAGMLGLAMITAGGAAQDGAAQDGAAVSGGAGAAATERLATGGLVSSLMAQPVRGQPFSAVQVTHTVQTLGDGTTVKHNGHHGVARDSDGRMRVEMRMQKAVGDQPEVVMVFVSDPVTHTLTTWMTGARDAKKVAAVVKLPRDAKPATPTAAAAAETKRREEAEARRPQPVMRTEEMGKQMMDGLTVTGVRTTTIVPPGRSGNDAAITKTHEVWTSTDLKLVLKQVWTDPRTGERSVALERMTRAEPEAVMFRPPAGYAVKDAVESLKELTDKLEAAGN